MTGNNLNLDLVNMNAYVKLVKFCQFVLKVVSGNGIMASIEGHYSVTNMQKRMPNNPSLAFLSI